MGINKIKLLSALILAFIAIAGCSGGKSRSSLTDEDIRVGTDGLEMTFLQNAPPKNVFEGGSFPISLRIKNAGASNIGDDPKTEDVVEQSGIIVFGFEKAYVGLVGNIKDEAGKLSNEKLNDKEREEKNALKENGINQEDLAGIIAISEKNPENPNDEEKKQLEKLEKFVEILANFRAKKYIEITGKQVFNPKGDESFISINAWAKKIGGQSETKPSTIFATACYPYKTILDASVCIDTDVIGQRRGQKSCKIKDLELGDGQGAPLAITKVETMMLPQDEAKIKPHFIIHIKNSGDGQVIRREAAKEDKYSINKVTEETKESKEETTINILERVCSSEPLSYMKEKDFNTFNVKATLSGVELDCNPDEKIGPGATEARLREKEDMIRCTYEKDNGIDANLDAYTAPLKVEMDYGYTLTISKDIIIEKLLTY